MGSTKRSIWGFRIPGCGCRGQIRERRLRGLKRKRRRRRRRKKRAREIEGVLGNQGVGMKGEIGGLPFGVYVIIVEFMDILQEIAGKGWGKGKELEGSKVVVIPVGIGDIPQGMPLLLL
jgi:hypothetical protein